LELDADIPESYMCPIGQDIMKDPVIAEDGHTYEKVNIETWVRKHGTSPITRETISPSILITNRVLKGQIENFIKERNENGTSSIKKSKSDDKPKKKKKEKEKTSLAQEVKVGYPFGISSVESGKNKNGNPTTIVTLEKNVPYESFYYLLEFLYTGVISKTKDTTEISTVAELFKCEHLVTACKNITEGMEFLNPSIGTWLNDENGIVAMNLLYNKKLLSDVTLQTPDGTTFQAHKTILSSRCNVLRAMFESHFREKSQKSVHIDASSTEAFSAFLTYLYSCHAPILESKDSVGILVLANQYNLPHLLTLCELYITKQVEIATRDDIIKADVDIIGLLLLSQLHNASQLEKFCLHFISSNYQPMKKREEFKMLKGENLKYVEENQWPPVSYLKELEEFEKTKGGENCSVM